MELIIILTIQFLALGYLLLVEYLDRHHRFAYYSLRYVDNVRGRWSRVALLGSLTRAS